MKKTLIALMAIAGSAFGADLVVDLKLDGNFTDSQGKLTFGDHSNNNNLSWADSPVIGSSKCIDIEGGDAAWNGSFSTAPSTTDFALTFFVNVGELPVFSNQEGKQESWAAAWIIGGNSTDGNNNLKIGIGTTGEVKVDVKNKFSLSSGANYTLDTNTWYQFGLSVTSSATQGQYDYTLYIDGVAIKTETKDAGVSWNKFTLFEGTDFVQNNKRIVGLVDDIQIYNVSSAEDAAALMSQQAARLIPEPTTATLSLLALAGLAARRRRASR